MTNEELVELAKKVNEGKATSEEVTLFAKEFKGQVEDLNNYLDSLPKK